MACNPLTLLDVPRDHGSRLDDLVASGRSWLSDEIPDGLRPGDVLHIVDACGARLLADGRKQPGLLGTAFTMAQPYFVDRLAEKTGLTPILPDAETQAELSRIIFEDLTHGIVRDEAKRYYEAAIQTLKDQGCDSIILGCTELGMLVTEENSPLPPYDTALIHCEAIVDEALSE